MLHIIITVKTYFKNAIKIFLKIIYIICHLKSFIRTNKMVNDDIKALRIVSPGNNKRLIFLVCQSY